MKNYSKIALGALLIGSAVLTVSCEKDEETTSMPTKASLYDRLGGTKMVADPRNPGQMIEQGRLSYRSVVDSTITLIVNDIVANKSGNFAPHFAPLLAEVGAGNTTNLSKLSKNLTDFFSANTGGGATNTYSGLDMVTAHDPAKHARMGEKTSNADYTRFIGFVGEAAGKNGVTDKAIITDVVAVLESLRSPIVQK